MPLVPIGACGAMGSHVRRRPGYGIVIAMYYVEHEGRLRAAR
jgi:hypothetical protein